MISEVRLTRNCCKGDLRSEDIRKERTVDSPGPGNTPRSDTTSFWHSNDENPLLELLGTGDECRGCGDNPCAALVGVSAQRRG